MKKIVTATLILLMMAACHQTELVLKNGTTGKMEMFLRPDDRDGSGSHYIVSPGKEITVGHLTKKGDPDFSSTPYMLVRHMNILDSTIYSGKKKVGSLNINTVDTLRFRYGVADSLFNEIIKARVKSKPKQVEWLLTDSLFKENTVKKINGVEISSGQYINHK